MYNNDTRQTLINNVHTSLNDNDSNEYISFNAGGFITLNFKSIDEDDKNRMHLAKVYYSHNNSAIASFFGMATGVLKSIDDGNSDKPRESQQEIKFYPSDDALDNSITKINLYKNTKYSVFKNNKIDFLKDIAKDYSNSEFFNISDAYSKSDIGSNFFGYMFDSMSKTEQAFLNYKNLNPKFEREINTLLEFSDPKKTVDFENSFIQLSNYKNRIPYYSENRPNPENDLQVKIANAFNAHRNYTDIIDNVKLSYDRQKAINPNETYIKYLLKKIRLNVSYQISPLAEERFIEDINSFEKRDYNNQDRQDINRKISNILAITSKICDANSNCNYGKFLVTTLSNYVYELVKRVIHSTRKTVAHRGISNDAPENTLPAFNAAHKRGYLFVEADVMFTKDNIPVVTHDLLINRTSNGQGSLKNSNYSDIQNYDFGYRSKWGNNASFDEDIKNTYKNIPSNYVRLKNGDLVAKQDGYEVTEKTTKTETGESKKSLDVRIKIPTFIDFVKQCKANGQIIYLDLKSTATYTKDQIKMLINILKSFNMLKQVVWISISVEHLKIVHELLPSAELGITSFPFRNSKLKQAIDFSQSGAENVFLHIQSPFCSENAVRKCRENDIELQLWALGGDIDEEDLDPYISSITTNPPKAN